MWLEHWRSTAPFQCPPEGPTIQPAVAMSRRRRSVLQRGRFPVLEILKSQRPAVRGHRQIAVAVMRTAARERQEARVKRAVAAMVAVETPFQAARVPPVRRFRVVPLAAVVSPVGLVLRLDQATALLAAMAPAAHLQAAALAILAAAGRVVPPEQTARVVCSSSSARARCLDLDQSRPMAQRVAMHRVAARRVADPAGALLQLCTAAIVARHLQHPAARLELDLA